MMVDDARQEAFDRLVATYEEDITLPTATALAKELGVWFEPDYYDPDVQAALISDEESTDPRWGGMG